ncbi:hypothetical protein AY599_25175 [Leptolyngbya valderiana BDU 20041]|nr:hypothetical protein AY599_25175 [Leptolyngbya valderiana BDU 20041]
MKAILDGQDLAIDRPTLAAALEAGAAAARDQGRIVIEVMVDGQPVEGEQLGEPSDEPLEAQVLEMTSTDPASLVRVTLFDAADAMESAKDEHAACAEMIHRGEMSEAMGALAQLLSTWQAVRQAVVQGGAAVGRPLSGYAAEGALEERTEALARQLDDLKRAVGNDDLVTVADLLEEDLRAEAGLWADTLRRIAEAMKTD